MWLDNERRDFKPGTLIIHPKGVAHAGKLVSSAPVKAIAIKLPPQPANDTVFPNQAFTRSFTAGFASSGYARIRMRRPPGASDNSRRFILKPRNLRIKSVDSDTGSGIMLLAGTAITTYFPATIGSMAALLPHRPFHRCRNVCRSVLGSGPAAAFALKCITFDPGPSKPGHSGRPEPLGLPVRAKLAQ